MTNARVPAACLTGVRAIVGEGTFDVGEIHKLTIGGENRKEEGAGCESEGKSVG